MMLKVDRLTWLLAIVNRICARSTSTTTTTTTTPEATECPLRCHCYRESSISSVFCVRAGLRAIPDWSNFRAQIVNFTGNDLPRIRDNAFGSGARARTVEILDLTGNGVQSVESNAFAELKNLQEIDLSNNRLGAMHGAKLFRHNRFLNTIRVSGNPIQELSDDAFPLSAYLRSVDFQGCRLSKIHRYAFYSAPFLQHLNLKDNALKSPPTAVLRLTQLRSLQLDGNPWRCDARLWRVLKWLQRHERARSSAGTDLAVTAVTVSPPPPPPPAPQSLPCVFGETENTVFWDTMEVDNFEKFRLSRQQQQQRGRRRRRRRRRLKRSINTRKTYASHHRNVNNGTGGRVAGLTDDGESRAAAVADTNVEPANCTQYYDYSPTKYLEHHYVDESAIQYKNAAARPTVKWPILRDNAYVWYERADRSNNRVDVQQPRPSRDAAANTVSVVVGGGGSPANDTSWTVQRQHERRRRRRQQLLRQRRLASHSATTSAAGIRFDSETTSQQRQRRVHAKHSSAPSVTNLPYRENDDDGDGSGHGHTNGYGVAVFNDNDNNDNNNNDNNNVDENDGDFIEQNHGIILSAEVVLIVILSIVLYQLWREKRDKCGGGGGGGGSGNAAVSATNVAAANNGDGTGAGARFNGFDTQAVGGGYKRYSLSDEEYSNIRNDDVGDLDLDLDLDEGKYDAESGYLSYHRYNSVEGENPGNGDHVVVASYHRSSVNRKNESTDDSEHTANGNRTRANSRDGTATGGGGGDNRSIFRHGRKAEPNSLANGGRAITTCATGEGAV